MIAHETSLLLFNLNSRESEKIVDLEADDPITRSNDGRADPWGGFWIGTMGKKLEKDAGAIYRYYRGELRTLYTPWTIPNAQCFSPNRDFAYLTDTPNGEILRQRLDPKTVGHWVIQKCSSPCQKAIFAPMGPLLMPKGVFGLPIMGTLKSPVTTRMVNWLIRSKCPQIVLHALGLVAWIVPHYLQQPRHRPICPIGWVKIPWRDRHSSWSWASKDNKNIR